MDEKEFLAKAFEANRRHLQSVAYRILGLRTEAEDAVQEAWFRLSRTDAAAVGNLSGWLTTVVARLSLDLLRGRRSRREEPIDSEAEAVPSDEDIERDTEFADSIGIAMLAVLDTLSPAERVAFVLHDVFNVPFDQIAVLIDRSIIAARQLASRARRRLQGETPMADTDRLRQEKIVSAFLAASRSGDFIALLAILDPDVVVRADPAAIAASIAYSGKEASALEPAISGRDSVAKLFIGQAQGAQVATVNGATGLILAPRGKLLAVFEFVIEEDSIVEIMVTADEQAIASHQVSF